MSRARVHADCPVLAAWVARFDEEPFGLPFDIGVNPTRAEIVRYFTSQARLHPLYEQRPMVADARDAPVALGSQSKKVRRWVAVADYCELCGDVVRRETWRRNGWQDGPGRGPGRRRRRTITLPAETALGT